MKQSFSYKKIGTSFLLLFVVIILISATNNNRYFQIAKQIEVFADAYKTLNEVYIDEIEPGQLMKSAIDGMLKDLDPYTNYISESKIQEFRLMQDGEYVGIGATGTWHNNRYLIDEIFEGFPAELSGLKIGDEILKIDGLSINNKNNDDVTALIRGQKKSVLNIEIKDEKNQIKTLNIQRGDVEIKAVPYFGIVNDDIAYINLTVFNKGCANEVKKAFAELKSKNKLKGLILDLRNNGGGLLMEANQICNIFIDKNKKIVDVKGRFEKRDETYETLEEAYDSQLPLAVLINEHSASASEIVSGVLQDYDRAIIIGEKSYGKGLVQNTQKSAYNSMMKFTTHKYFLPSGRCIQNINYYGKFADGKNKEKLPDSLRQAFTTVNKRIVYNNSGIEPDIYTNNNQNKNLLDALQKQYIYDFALQYCRKNSKPNSINEIKLEENDLEQFIQKINVEQLHYKNVAEKYLSNIEKSIKEEKLEMLADNDFKQLQQEYKQWEKTQLQLSKNDIKQNLLKQIALYYFYRKGAIELSLQYDNDVAKAKEILTSATKMKEILKMQ
jgi:carboxyl-terminal processing protease